MEWYLLAVLGVLAGVSTDLILATISGSFTRPKEKIYHLNLKKRRYHHSCIGLCCIIISIFIWFFFLFSYAIGIILSHSIREKSILFIETPNKKYF
jgi:predicted anti-sigma-YlaC factor YlaD